MSDPERRLNTQESLQYQVAEYWMENILDKFRGQTFSSEQEFEDVIGSLFEGNDIRHFGEMDDETKAGKREINLGINAKIGNRTDGFTEKRFRITLLADVMKRQFNKDEEVYLYKIEDKSQPVEAEKSLPKVA